MAQAKRRAKAPAKTKKAAPKKKAKAKPKATAPVKKAVAKKAIAKKPVAKKPVAKKKASSVVSTRNDLDKVFDSLIQKASRHIEGRGGRLVIEKGMSDDAIEKLCGSIKPHYGSLSYALSPAYRAFLRKYGGVYAEGGGYHPDTFAILGPQDVKNDTRELVHVPKGVEWENERDEAVKITTNHLVAFASAGDSEGRWCFAVDTPGPDGELPVYFHHQDDPRSARDAKTGEWIYPSAAKPAYPDFVSWLREYVDEFCDDARRSGPSAYRR
jgi:hypothetical protein